jgi:hypothetical protein
VSELVAIAALRRTLPYLDRLPTTVADEIRRALDAYEKYELDEARRAIVQEPGKPMGQQ